MNPAWIGQDAVKILAEICVQVEPAPRLLICDEPRDHSLVSERQVRDLARGCEHVDAHDFAGGVCFEECGAARRGA